MSEVAESVHDETKADETQEAQKEESVETETFLTEGAEHEDAPKEEEVTESDTPEEEAEENEEESDTQSAPESYEPFTLPEDSELDEQALEKFEALAKDANLSQEMAQRFVDQFVERLQSMQEESSVALQEQGQEWLKELKNDPDYGGKRLKSTQSDCARAMRVFGSRDLDELLDSTQLGNHPAMIKAFARIGKAMSEDITVVGKHAAAEPAKPLAEILYPQNPTT